MANKTNQSIGKTIDQFCKKNWMTIRTLAKIAGLPSEYVHMVSMGRSKPNSKLLAFLKHGNIVIPGDSVKTGSYYKSRATKRKFKVVAIHRKKNYCCIVDYNEKHSTAPLDEINNALLKGKIKEI